MIEIKLDKYVQTLSFIRYNKKELKNQSIINLQNLLKSSGAKLNDIFNSLEGLIV